MLSFFFLPSTSKVTLSFLHFDAMNQAIYIKIYIYSIKTKKQFSPNSKMLTFNSDIIKSESNCHNKKMPKLFIN